MPSVTAGELKRRIQSLLGDSSGTFITAEDCYDWILDAEQEIAKITECLTVDLTPINSVANQERYALDAKLLKVVRVTYSGEPLRPVAMNYLDNVDPHRDNNPGGVPVHYYLDGNDLGLWPKPATAVANAIKIRARVIPTALPNDDSDIIEIPDYFKENIITFASIKGREKDESPEFLAVLMDAWRTKIATAKSIANNPEATYASVQDVETMIDYPSWTS